MGFQIARYHDDSCLSLFFDKGSNSEGDDILDRVVTKEAKRAKRARTLFLALFAFFASRLGLPVVGFSRWS
jgi:hypothetical protein